MNNQEFIAHIDPDLEELIPGFLENKKKDIETMKDALSKKEIETIRLLGHRMKGAGAGYGFEEISTIGHKLEEAANQGNRDIVPSLIEELEHYINNVKIVYDGEL